VEAFPQISNRHARRMAPTLSKAYRNVLIGEGQSSADNDTGLGKLGFHVPNINTWLEGKSYLTPNSQRILILEELQLT